MTCCNPRSWLLSIAVVVVAVLPGAASSVIPPTFSELVANATEIFVGHVVSRDSQWLATTFGPVIVTDVTFAVEDRLKGDRQERTTLRFRGGTVGDVTLTVADMPEFQVGDRVLLFVGDRNAVSPLVGFMHGRFRIQRDQSTASDRVATHDGRPLAATALLGATGALPRTPARGLSLTEFRAEILARLRERVAR